MRTDITQADAVDDVCPVLAYIGASSPSGVLNWIVSKLIDFTATSDDYIALFECVIVFSHTYNIRDKPVEVNFFFNYFRLCRKSLTVNDLWHTAGPACAVNP
jgi:hypothetical protein